MLRKTFQPSKTDAAVQQEWEKLSGMTQEQAQAIAAWASQGDYVSPVEAADLGMAGLDPMTADGAAVRDVITRRQLQYQQAQPQKKRSLWDKFLSGAGKVTRPAFATLQAPFEIINATVKDYTSLIDSIIDPNEKNRYDRPEKLDIGGLSIVGNFQETTLAQSLGKDEQGNDLGLGEGLFAQGSAAQAQAKLARQQGSVLSSKFTQDRLKDLDLSRLVEGDDYIRNSDGTVQFRRGFTIGRGTATVVNQVTNGRLLNDVGYYEAGIDGKKRNFWKVWENGAFGLVSGSIDLVANWKGDPVNKLTEIQKGFTKSGEFIDAGDRAMRFAKAAGRNGAKLDELELQYLNRTREAVRSGPYANLADQVDNPAKAFWVSDANKPVIKQLADSKSTSTIFESFKGQIDFTVAKRLAETSNEEEVLKLGFDIIDGKHVDAAGNPIIMQRKASLRPFSEQLSMDDPKGGRQLTHAYKQSGRAAFDVDEPVESYTNLKRFLDSTSTPSEAKRKILDSLANSFGETNEVLRRDGTAKVLFDSLLGEDGAIVQQFIRNVDGGKAYVDELNSLRAAREAKVISPDVFKEQLIKLDTQYPVVSNTYKNLLETLGVKDSQGRYISQLDKSNKFMNVDADQVARQAKDAAPPWKDLVGMRRKVRDEEKAFRRAEMNVKRNLKRQAIDMTPTEKQAFIEPTSGKTYATLESEFVAAQENLRTLKGAKLKKAEKELARQREVLYGLVPDYAQQSLDLAKRRLDDASGSYDNAARKYARKENTVQSFGPQRVTEMLNRPVQLPTTADMRKIEKATRRAVAAKALMPVEMANETLGSFIDNVWKPAVLLRPAFVTRQVFIDSAMRASLAGYKSSLTNPLAWISYAMLEQDSGRFARTLRRLGVDPAGNVDATGKTIVQADKGAIGYILKVDEQGKEITERMHASAFSDAIEPHLIKNGLDDPRYGRFEATTFRPTDSGYREALIEEALDIAKDPVQSALVRGHLAPPDIARLVDLGIIDPSRGLKRIRQLRGMEKAGRIPMGREAILKELDRGMFKEYREAMAASGKRMQNPAAVENYVDTLIANAKRVLHDDPELIRAVTDNRMSKPVHMKQLLSAVDSAEAKGVFRNEITGMKPVRAASDEMSKWQQGVRGLFDRLVSYPEARFAKSPVYRQAYWDRAEALAHRLSDADRKILMNNARKANLPASRMKKLEVAVSRAVPREPVSLQAVSDASHATAIYTIRDIFFDHHKRSDIGNALKLIAPFADAQYDALKTYGKLFGQAPLEIYNAQKALTGIQESPFMQTDPVTGEQYFMIPGSEAVNKMIAGVPFPSRMRAQSLNLITQGGILPGGGPILQVLGSRLLSSRPDADWLTNYIAPYGDPTEKGIAGAVIPSWVQKILTGMGAWDQDGARYQASVAATMKYLASTGEYDLTTDIGVEAMYDDAVRSARNLYLIEGFAASVAPASPNYVKMIETSEGIAQLDPLIQVYRQSVDELVKTQNLDYFDATDLVRDQMLEIYGDQIAVGLESTNKTRAGVQFTNEFDRWAADNNDVQEAAPNFWGYFGPTSPEGDAYDPRSARRARENGDLEAVDPRDIIRKMNARDVEDEIDTIEQDWMEQSPTGKLTSEERQILAELRQNAKLEIAGVGQRAESIDIDAKIQELEAGALVALGRGNVTAGYVLAYIEQRDKSLAIIRDADTVSFDSGRAIETGQPDLLFQMGESFAAQDFSFARLWDRVLKSEVSK